MTAFAPVPLRKLVSEVSTWNPLKPGNEDEAFEYIDLSAIDQERKVITGARTVQCAEAPSRARQLVQEGDVLVSTVRPNLNGVAMVPPHLNRATASTGFCVIRANRAVLEPGYAFHWVKSPAFVSSMAAQATGASYPAVSDRIVLNSEIPLPPLSEQRRIAAILDKADALRSKRREALAQLDCLAQSIFVEMFGGNNNERAKEVSLADVAHLITKGTTPTTLGMEFVESGVPFVRVQNLVSGSVDWTNDILYIDATTHEKLARSKVFPGDVLLSIAGTIGRVAVVPELAPSMNCNQAVALVRVDRQRLTPQYLRYWLGSNDAKRQIREGMVTGTITNLSLSQIRNLGVTLPSMEKQAEFLHRLSALSALEARHREAERGHEALLSSLQKSAFRG